MAYSIIDILDSLIDIEKKAIGIFEDLSAISRAGDRLSVISKIFILEEKRHISNYEQLKQTFSDDPGKEIDFNTYNDIASYFNEFYKNLKPISAKTVQELLMYSYRLEVQNSKLLENILKLFSTFKNNKVYKQCHDVILQLIEEERKHVNNILLFVK